MKRNEKEEIKRDGAKAVKNSGRGIKKGDATISSFLVDYKHCGRSFTVSIKKWIKHSKDAWNDSYKYPCYSLVLGEDSEVKLAVIEWDLFRELIEDTEYGGDLK
tara:strand:+ start:1130 stop:1441 length:312 start_codon:yes stop_codon:yes gene_type:complete